MQPDGKGWLMPLGTLRSSVVVCWPVTEHTMTNQNTTYFPPVDHVGDFRKLFQFVWCLEEWEASEIEWQAPLSLATRHAGGSTPPTFGLSSIVALKVGDVADLLMLVVSSCFLLLGVAFLAKLVKYLGLEYTGEKSLFGYLKNCQGIKTLSGNTYLHNWK